jgi:hypothetical protein
MCAKVQVTFCVRASETDLPLGQPIALVFMASDGELTKITFLVPAGEGMMIDQHWRFTSHQLRTQLAEEINRVVADGVWERLLMTEGIQEELAGLWGEEEPVT